MSELTAHNLSKRYRQREVVKDVSLTVKSGEVIGLLGPNGAGKTTSFHMIVGLIPCDSGQILADGNDITHRPMDERARMGLGYLPQEASVFRKLSVEDNVRAVLEVLPHLNAKQQARRLDNLLREFHLDHLRGSMGASLSGGERRRLEIARALATEPRFILLDEPFAGVDPISVIDIQKIVQHLCNIGIGVLVTDHNVRETLGICNRAYIVSEGRIIAEGDPDTILADDHVRDVYLGAEFKL
ncbi:MAG: LPS export ABC transporter ATP-binding protein [Gammaproteobacteria bacterium]|nr:LPS export ABC transporter ATP-binding protein [Gammaproteobacteria bacterium]MCG3144488.1 Lipopolysaccharide export system ATP-binding protein LptB [Gammaproteobacteria bacterium]